MSYTILYRRFYTHTTETLAFLFQHAQGPCTRSFKLGCWHFTSDEIDFLFHLSLRWLHQPSLMTLHGFLKLCGSLKLHENACGIGSGGGGGGCVKPLSNSLRVCTVEFAVPSLRLRSFSISFFLSLSCLFSLFFFFCCMILSLLGLVSDAPTTRLLISSHFYI